MSTRVFPIIPVDKKSDKYFIYAQNDWFRDEAQVRPPSTESAGSGYNLSTTSYLCEDFALHKDLDNQVLQNADEPLNLMREAVMFITQKMLLRQELQWVADYFTTSVWDNDVTPTNLWSDYAASDPVDDVELGKETMLGQTGYEPNTLVLGYQVFRKLKQHPDVIDRIKYTQNAINAVTEGMLASLFGVERVLVAKAIKATNVEGAAAAYAFTHGKHALLAYVAPNPGLMTPSAGYTFAWRGVSRGIGSEIGIFRFPMNHLRSERVEAEKAWDNKVVGTNLGYFFNGAVS